MILVLVQATLADDPPDFAGASTETLTFETPTSRVAAELGGAFTAGNTRTYTLNASLDADHGWGHNRLGIDTGVNLGRSIIDADGDGHIDMDEHDAGWVETARKLWIDLRYDRYVSPRESLYALGGTLVDPFAGYDNRSHVQVGYSRLLFQDEDTHMVSEIGLDGAREDYVQGVDPGLGHVVAVRMMLGLTHTFNENVSFTNKLEVYENVPNLVDLRILNQASIGARLADTLSLKLSHNLVYDHDPVEGYQPLDHTTTVTFVAHLL